MGSYYWKYHPRSLTTKLKGWVLYVTNPDKTSAIIGFASNHETAELITNALNAFPDAIAYASPPHLKPREPTNG